MSADAPLQRVRDLKQRAESILKADLQDGFAAFFQSLELYLAEFDEWQTSGEAERFMKEAALLPEAEKRKRRKALEEYFAVHQAATAFAAEQKTSVVQKMGEVRKRSRALKKYIDRYPSRISITGKREG